MTGPDAPPDPAGIQEEATSVDPHSLLEWEARLRASAGHRAIALKNQVKRIGYIFQGNVGQYRSLLANLQNPSVSFPMLDPRNGDAHDDLLSEAERLLHNVLTAMSTRVDQQRRFVDKYFKDDPVLTKEYSERVASSFEASSEAAFLKGLRNYITHAQLPIAQSRQTFGPESFSVTFILPSGPLLTWDDWNSDTRAWIARQGEDVAIVDAVNSYARLAGEFDKWLFDRIGLKYKTEIEIFLNEREQYNQRLGRVFGAQRSSKLTFGSAP